MNVRKLRLLWILGLVACDDFEPDITRERGDLGRGKFIYECLGETDSACESATTKFPQAVAVNSRFAMRFAIDSGVQPAVIPGASTFVQSVVGGFKVLRAGELALLAVNGNREVIDIKHLRSAPIAQVRVRRGASLPEAELNLQTGESVELTAVPFDALGVELGGAVDYAWSSEDPQIARVETFADLNRIRIRALRSGDTTLNVTAGGENLSLVVHTSGADLDPDATAPIADAGTQDDAGVEADGGDA